jgi:hypothetical protein
MTVEAVDATLAADCRQFLKINIVFSVIFCSFNDSSLALSLVSDSAMVDVTGCVIDAIRLFTSFPRRRIMA